MAELNRKKTKLFISNNLSALEFFFLKGSLFGTRIADYSLLLQYKLKVYI
jgi:hypothetical protein